MESSMQSNALIINHQEKTHKLKHALSNAISKSKLYQEKFQKKTPKYDDDQEFIQSFEKLPLLSRDEYYQGRKSPNFPLLTEGLINTYFYEWRDNWRS